MNVVRDIQTLSTFKRQSTKFVKQVQVTREPLVLTINGVAELVVLDAESYQVLSDMKERAEALVGVREGLAQARCGEVIAMEQVLSDLGKQHGLDFAD
jgi:prevent-host-death family protein